ncbi:MAG: NRDE family protein [Bermanella sp.]
MAEHYEGFSLGSPVVIKDNTEYTAPMCLICFQFAPDSDTPLTIVANRDEFHARPSRSAQFWEDSPHVLAGLDLQAGGTWMGVTKEGRFAAITNVRRIPAPHEGSISRGKLVADFLRQEVDCESYLQALHHQGRHYNGFNLIVGNRQQCWYLSNHNDAGPRRLAPGLYGLSNAQLDTHWPKVEFAKQALERWLAQPQDTPLYSLLDNCQGYPQDQLPDTGIGQEWEELLSPAFIVSPSYGTRASTGLHIQQDKIQLQEASFNAQGQLAKLVSFEF